MAFTGIDIKLIASIIKTTSRNCNTFDNTSDGVLLFNIAILTD